MWEFKFYLPETRGLQHKPLQIWSVNQPPTLQEVTETTDVEAEVDMEEVVVEVEDTEIEEVKRTTTTSA